MCSGRPCTRSSETPTRHVWRTSPSDWPRCPPRWPCSRCQRPAMRLPDRLSPPHPRPALQFTRRPRRARRSPAGPCPAPTSPPHPESSPAPSTPTAYQPSTPPGGEHTPTKLVDEQAPDTTAESLATVQPLQPEIAIRDVRREEGPSAWVSSVGRLLARHAEDGLPFAVLLVEIVDVAQLERSETPHDLHGLVAKVESALGQGMRASDHLSRETLGRYWLVAPETNGTGARMLAERPGRRVRTSCS